MSKSVFISHAVKDKEIANKLVDLLETGIGIRSNNVFCSSLEGMGIPSGVNFVEFIKGQIQDPKCVILLLTPNYYKSAFCLSELGASWAMTHNTIPIIVEPLKFKDIKDVLTGIQVRKILDKNDLNEIQGELTEALNIDGYSFAKWEVKRDEFIEAVNKMVPVEVKDEFIDIDKYETTRNNYEEAKEDIESLLKEIDEQKELIEKLKEAKDKKDVQEIIKEDLNTVQQFEELREKIREEVEELPEIVLKAIFHHYLGENMRWPGWGHQYETEQIRDAIENDYLEDYGERGVGIVEEDPKIARTIKAINELAEFLQTAEEDSDFIDYYYDEFDHRINLESKRFWEAHIF